MKRFSRSRSYANVKLANSLVFIGLGVFIALEILRSGFRVEFISGMVLALAFIALGTIRVRAYFKEKKST